MTWYNAGIAKDCCLDRPRTLNQNDVTYANYLKATLKNYYEATFEVLTNPSYGNARTLNGYLLANWGDTVQLPGNWTFSGGIATHYNNKPKSLYQQSYAGELKLFESIEDGIKKVYYLFDTPLAGLTPPPAKWYMIPDSEYDFLFSDFTIINGQYVKGNGSSCSATIKPIFTIAETMIPGGSFQYFFNFTNQCYVELPNPSAGVYCPQYPTSFSGQLNRLTYSPTPMLPDNVTAKFIGTPNFSGNKEPLHECHNKTFLLSWDYENGYYISDWQYCGNQPFRIIGNIPTTDWPRGGIDFNSGLCPPKIVGNIIPISYFIFYPSYPYTIYPISGATQTGHGNYNTAGHFEFKDGGGLVGL